MSYVAVCKAKRKCARCLFRFPPVVVSDVFKGLHKRRGNAEVMGSVLPMVARAAVVAAMQTQRETQNPFLDYGASVWVQYRGLWGVPSTFHVNVCLFHPLCKL